jgi:prephenate dehydrogenase
VISLLLLSIENQGRRPWFSRFYHHVAAHKEQYNAEIEIQENSMPIQLTIIGLGQIGTSVGLALAERKDLIKRVGHDKEAAVARRAQSIGALDQVQYNLPASVREADIVLLALPQNAIRETLEYIAQDLKEGAVVMDTAPVKSVVAGWARELLPDRRYYVGLVPAINPTYLHETTSGAAAAHPDLFTKGLMGIVSPPGTPGDAIKLAADLAKLLGAEPFFIDLAESDGLIAKVHLLPQLVAVALLNATVDRPGWVEARKLAGRAYAGVTGPITYQDQLAGLRDAALHNKENVTRVLDGLIASLQDIREDIAAEGIDSLTKHLEQALDGRIKWQSERESAQWQPPGNNASDLPTSGEFIRQFFGGKLFERRKK